MPPVPTSLALALAFFCFRLAHPDNAFFARRNAPTPETVCPRASPAVCMLQVLAQCRAIAQAASRWLPTAAVRGSSPGLVMWDFVVDKVALGQVFSEYFGFPCQSSFHQLLQNHPHLSSGFVQ
jgi:hypothetical protein